ncbi:hypothetical protein UAW_00630 [Enterococcus haemoperoxidus ATCC BAA-382]|uniref:Uncharacterized protein n=3 Tax=Enterococcus haemoperoxidus TaxID=155618 RepID=R2QVU1_9ENTE|nr:hypothetical protein UAW_00630 [Enterococcus haemoperoxidus ATCC BAA-382]EOT62782.1 hypothetical protein I583_01783 [Enterococcus haemoperoxidus ATCC BAA-382]
MGRFLQEDTWYGKVEQPQSQNRYIYVENNPQKYRDRSGNAGWWSKAWNNVKKQVKKVAQKVWNGVKKIASTVWNGVKAVWNAVVPSSPRVSSSWGGIASGVRYVGNYVGRTYYPQRSYVGVNYIRGRNGQPVGYQTYSQALYYQSAAYRYQVQVQRAQATRMMATVRIKKVCDTADKKWTGKKSSEEQLKEFEKKYGKSKIMKNEILFIPGGGAIGLLGKAKNTLDWAKNAIGIGKIFQSASEAMGNSNSRDDKIKDGNLDDLGEHVRDIYNRYDKAKWGGNVSGQTQGTKAGAKYKNDGRDNSAVLPEEDSDGNDIEYEEFDVNNKIENENRDGERFIKGSDGSIYYTDDHYKTFIKIK